jgi:hypothetical protein
MVMAPAQCAIWKMPAELLEKAGDFEGGKYWISGTAIGEVAPFTDNAKRLLTTWLCEQRRAGIDVPRVRSDVLALVRARSVTPITGRLTATLRTLGKHITRLGSNVQLGTITDPDTLRFLAETESSDPTELMELLRMLEQTGLIEADFYLDSSAICRPSARGWAELDNLNRRPTDSFQAFVAMWFNDATTDAYVSGIAPAITQMGYKPMRVDQKEHNNKIDDEIIAEVRRSRFLVADFTCEPKKVRGGVYYEAGFAQGLGIPVIWTCKDTSIDDLHFDTRQYAHIRWTTPADLLTQLKNRIGATIGEGPLPKS